MEKKNKIFSNFFKMFDYFGVNFTFKIKDQATFKTKFGGRIFLLFLILAIVYFCDLFLDFWNKVNYTVNNSILINTPAPIINFKNSSFNLAYSLLYDNNNSVLDPKTIGLSLNLFLTTIKNNNYSNPIKNFIINKNCPNFFGEIQNDTFTSLNLNNFQCAILNDSNSMEIQGTFSDSLYRFLQLSVSIQDNHFNQGNLSILNEFFTNNAVKLVLYWTDSTIDVKNITNPVSSYLSDYILYVNFDVIQKVNIDMSIIHFSSDNNMIYRDPKSLARIAIQQQVQYSLSTHNRTALGLSQGKTLINLYFRSSPSIIIIDRIYQKLSTLLANFAGIMSNILLGLYFFMGILNQFWAEQQVMNRILKFRDHMKVNYKNQLDLMKKNLKKCDTIDSSSIPPFKVEFPNRDKLIEKINEKRIIHIDEDKLKDNSKCNLYNYNYVSKIKNIEIELNKKDEIPKIFQDNTIELNIKNLSNLKEDTPKEIVLDNKPSFITHLNSKKEIYKRESIHHLKLKQRQEAIYVDKTVEKIYSKSKTALNFNCFEILFRKCCWKSKRLTLKNLLYKKANKKLSYYFDVYSYIRKMQEIDILKYLILDKNQVNLFNFLSRPTISKLYSDSDDIYQNMLKTTEFHNEIKNEEINEIVQSYNISMDKNDDVNKRLFYLFDYELDNLLIG